MLAYRAALVLGVDDLAQRVDELVGGIDVDDIDVHVTPERVEDALGLLAAHEAVVHEDTGELIAYGPVYETCRYGRIDAAGQCADHLAVPHLPSNVIDRVLDEVARIPVSPATTDCVDEVLQNSCPVRRVDDLRVELNADDVPCVRSGGDRRILGLCDCGETRGLLDDAVAVAHPNGKRRRKAFKDGMLSVPLLQHGVPVFPLAARLDLASQLVHDRLHPIANAEHGEALVEHPRRGQGCAEVIDARRAAGEDHTLGVEVYNFIPVGGVLDQLTVDVRFPHSSRDQAAVLGAEVDDQDRLALSVMG